MCSIPSRSSAIWERTRRDLRPRPSRLRCRFLLLPNDRWGQLLMMKLLEPRYLDLIASHLSQIPAGGRWGGLRCRSVGGRWRGYRGSEKASLLRRWDCWLEHEVSANMNLSRLLVQDCAAGTAE
ncbi:unnamed protein product, partial [Tilletia caries]